MSAAVLSGSSVCCVVFICRKLRHYQEVDESICFSLMACLVAAVGKLLLIVKGACICAQLASIVGVETSACRL